MTIEIANIKTTPKTATTFYIGRKMPNQIGSPLANPYRISNTLTRTESIEKYRLWLWQQIKKQNKTVLDELLKLHQLNQKQTITLLCWCKPKPCHGDVIKDCLASTVVQKILTDYANKKGENNE